MATNPSVKEIFMQAKTSKIHEAIIQALEDPTTIGKLKKLVTEEGGNDEEIAKKLREKPKEVNWNDVKFRHTRTSLETFWEELDPKQIPAHMTKNSVFRMMGNEGEYTRGLRLDMTVAELDTLLAANADKFFEPMATFRRRKLHEEKRNFKRAGGKINWYKTLIELKNYANENRYSEKMTLQMIQELATDQDPEMQEYFEAFDSLNKISKHLIGKDPVTYTKECYFKMLKNFKREKNQELQAAMNHAQELYRLAHDCPEASTDKEHKNYNQGYELFSISTLMQIMEPKASAEFKEVLAQMRENRETIRYTTVFDGAHTIERKTGVPSTDRPLKYMTTEEVTIQINNLSITSPKLPKRKQRVEIESSSDSEDEQTDVWMQQRYSQDPRPSRKSSVTKSTTPRRQSVEDVFHSPQANTPEASSRRSYYQFTDKIQLPERTQKSEYEQAKIDSVILKQDQVIKKSIDRLIRSYQKSRDQTIQLSIDNKVSVQWNSIRRDMANEMKTMFNKRTALAVIFDDIDKFYNDKRKNHETLCKEFMENFELEKRTTRSRNSSGTVEIHNYNNYEYNKNADFILRNQDRSNEQYRRSKNTVA